MRLVRRRTGVPSNRSGTVRWRPTPGAPTRVRCWRPAMGRPGATRAYRRCEQCGMVPRTARGPDDHGAGCAGGRRVTGYPPRWSDPVAMVRRDPPDHGAPADDSAGAIGDTADRGRPVRGGLPGRAAGPRRAGPVADRHPGRLSRLATHRLRRRARPGRAPSPSTPPRSTTAINRKDKTGYTEAARLLLILHNLHHRAGTLSARMAPLSAVVRRCPDASRSRRESSRQTCSRAPAPPPGRAVGSSCSCATSSVVEIGGCRPYGERQALAATQRRALEWRAVRPLRCR